MRTRKAELNRAPLIRLGHAILGYIDLFVRTICIILGLVVSGWVKFIDETPTAATNHGSGSSAQASSSRQLAPLPFTAAQPMSPSHPPLFR